MFYVIRFGRFLSGFIIFISILLYSRGFLVRITDSVLVNNFFILDGLSFYTVVLIIFLGIYSKVCFFKYISNETRMYLFFSLLFSALCFCCNHVILFWCFYELGMLPLIYLIFKESPYSERFLAGWYFCGYLLVTSLPLILVLIYLSVLQGSFVFRGWSFDDSIRVLVYILLSFIFFTKVPLTPFHTWLPIVHAEATRIVSIFLSGYIMKMGLLGVYRSTWVIFGSSRVNIYLFICLISCVYFFFRAIRELDGKRWLAFLRLAHIVVPFLRFFVSDQENIVFMFLYCLGHGLGAGVVFGLLWWFYEVCKSRNWLLIKTRVSKNVSLILIRCLRLLILCSFPSSLNFFCEVNFVKVSCFNLMYIAFWVIYLFLGGLIPSVLCGHLLTRCEFVDKGSSGFCNWVRYLLYLCVWCYLGIIYF